MDELKELIAKNLIHFRTMAGLTQLELATKLNYSDKSISKWERGVAIPDVLVLKQLADIYGIKVDDFFEGFIFTKSFAPVSIKTVFPLEEYNFPGKCDSTRFLGNNNFTFPKLLNFSFLSKLETS